MITVNLRYTGTCGNAHVFAEEMMSSGTVDKIRAEEGNLQYEKIWIYRSLNLVLMIWRNYTCLMRIGANLAGGKNLMKVAAELAKKII